MFKETTQPRSPNSGPQFEAVLPCESKRTSEWNEQVVALADCLGAVAATVEGDVSIDTDRAFDLWCETTEVVRQAERVIYLIGNGASASMASHFAADLAKNAELHTQVFTDTSLITAVANDLSYDMVFVTPLRQRLKGGDMVVAISSSGNSPNVLKAAEWAALRKATVVTLSAMQPDNALRQLGALNFWLPADTYGMAETGHAAILHHWMDRVSLQR
ncbi:SIS domain-containing protein [Anaerobaca lacustris]|uniref:SIS domain-containing protein n=1 Tax=Anaerobaca lacustris TaxID=3044600 RepID=A0AAW6TXF8_9BACT|nr:SIS domain-containing protein [Sedimentisphaerales bacterium M17dextr]